MKNLKEGLKNPYLATLLGLMTMTALMNYFFGTFIGTSLSALTVSIVILCKERPDEVREFPTKVVEFFGTLRA